MAKTPIIHFKRGDDFKLDLTVTDTNNPTAIAAKTTLDAAQVDYDAALAADPQVALDVTNTKTALDAAQASYDAAIIVDITGWTITSSIAWCGKHVADFTVILTDPLIGKFTVSAAAILSQTFIPRPYDADIQFVRPAGKVSSQTFIIEVLKDITNG